MTEQSSSTPKEESIPVQKSGIIAIVITLLLLAIAVGAWWMNDTHSIEDLTPEEATQVMLDQMEQLESFSFTADIELDPLLTAGMFADPTVTQSLSDAMGIQNPNNLVLRMNGALDMLTNEQQMSYTLEGGLKNDDTESLIRLDLVSTSRDEQHVRVRIPEALQALAESEFDGFDVSFALDQWVTMRPKEIIQQLGLESDFEKMGLSTDTLFDAPSEEQEKRVDEVSRLNWFLPLTEKMETDEIDGIRTIKYRAELDLEKASTLYLETIQLQRDLYAERGADEEFLAALDDTIESYKKSDDFKNLFAEIEQDAEFDVFVWLDASSGMPIRLQMAIRAAEPPKLGGVLTITLSDHNEPQDIHAPEDTMSLHAFVGEVVLRAAGTEYEEFVDSFTQEFQQNTSR